MKEGEKATLSVHVEGEDMEIKWMRDGIRLVTPTQHILQVNEEPGNYKLVIEQVR